LTALGFWKIDRPPSRVGAHKYALKCSRLVFLLLSAAQTFTNILWALNLGHSRSRLQKVWMGWDGMGMVWGLSGAETRNKKSTTAWQWVGVRLWGMVSVAHIQLGNWKLGSKICLRTP